MKLLKEESITEGRTKYLIIETQGSETIEAPKKDINIINEINKAVRILIKYKNLSLLEIIVNGRNVSIRKRNKITFTPMTLFGILLKIA